jgi:hypothetical protein
MQLWKTRGNVNRAGEINDADFETTFSKCHVVRGLFRNIGWQKKAPAVSIIWQAGAIRYFFLHSGAALVPVSTA